MEKNCTDLTKQIKKDLLKWVKLAAKLNVDIEIAKIELLNRFIETGEKISNKELAGADLYSELLVIKIKVTNELDKLRERLN